MITLAITVCPQELTHSLFLCYNNKNCEYLWESKIPGVVRISFVLLNIEY